MKIPSEEKISIATTDNNKNLNGLVNGDNRKIGRKKGAAKVIENHKKDAENKEVVAGTKPKKKNKSAPKQSEEELQELTKLDLCSIINRNREPIASSSRITDTAVNTDTLIDDLKDLNIDTELSDIASCAAETEKTLAVREAAEEEIVEEEVKQLPPIDYVQYESELQMPMIMKLIQKDLSEPYSIYTYRYFIYNWPKLCFLVCATNRSLLYRKID